MQFNSYIFILVYFPFLFLGYFSINKVNITLAKVFLVIMSAIFYMYSGLVMFLVLSGSILVNYLFCILLNKGVKGKKVILVTNIVLNIALLFYFKYINFFCENLGKVIEVDFNLREIILPLGISFFTFQQIMYAVNVYQNNIKDIILLDYLFYILYFPKILMGPLVEPVELINQFNDRSRKQINLDNVANGIKVFSFGLFKKLILADTFASAVNWGYSNIEISSSMDWFLIMLFYTFEIYFDFSGYSDMAVAVSKILNIDLPINFDSPYKALSIRDFWKRWHISLTSFFTKYIYIPLGGSKKGEVRTYVNTIIVFCVSGIWHGANWTFILWGILHGLLSISDRIFEKQKKLVEVVRWGVTFLSVNILWLLFRSESIQQWLHLLLKMFTFQNMEISKGLLYSFVLPETPFLLEVLHLQKVNAMIRGMSLLIFVLSAYGICLVPENNYKSLHKNNWFMMLLSAIAFIWSFLCISSESVFVYFNF